MAFRVRNVPGPSRNGPLARIIPKILANLSHGGERGGGGGGGGVGG